MIVAVFEVLQTANDPLALEGFGQQNIGFI